MSYVEPDRMDVIKSAARVRDLYKRNSDPVLSGDFDTFIRKLARQMAHDLYIEYGNSDNVSISDLSCWHGDQRDSITRDKFDAMCSAHGIPQEIIADNGTAGRDFFDGIFSRRLMESFGWEYSDAVCL